MTTKQINHCGNGEPPRTAVTSRAGMFEMPFGSAWGREQRESREGEVIQMRAAGYKRWRRC